MIFYNKVWLLQTTGTIIIIIKKRTLSNMNGCFPVTKGTVKNHNSFHPGFCSRFSLSTNWLKGIGNR